MPWCCLVTAFELHLWLPGGCMHVPSPNCVGAQSSLCVQRSECQHTICPNGCQSSFASPAASNSVHAAWLHNEKVRINTELILWFKKKKKKVIHWTFLWPSECWSLPVETDLGLKIPHLGIKHVSAALSSEAEILPLPKRNQPFQWRAFLYCQEQREADVISHWNGIAWGSRGNKQR